ncbi:MAG: phosphoglucosamine mutase [Planctomycetota bacterium]
MADAPLMLGVSGLRGIVGESLTPDVAARYAGAFGAWLLDGPAQQRSPLVVVARDGRAGGGALLDVVIGSLRQCGLDVIDLGIATTPTVGVLADVYSSCCGAMIATASHNPGEWNGLKCLVKGAPDIESSGSAARAPLAIEAAQIIERFNTGDAAWVGNDRVGSLTRDSSAAMTHARHVAALARELGGDPAGMRVVVDSVNCSGAQAAGGLLGLLGCRVVQLAGDGSGVFPHVPEPTETNLSVEGGLMEAVPGLKAQIGFAQDPDADRLALIDETGAYVGEEYTLALAAESVLSATGEKANGAVLAANLSTSRMIDDVSAKYGAGVVRTAVGEANVVEGLLGAGRAAVLGGEGNGGVIWPGATYVRDSLSAMALVLSLMSRTGKPLSELAAAIPSYAIVKTKAPLASKADAEPAVAAVASAFADQRTDTADGVRVDWDELPSGFGSGGGAGWVHVRASNTEPIMRVIAEAPTEAQARGIVEAAERVIAGGR